MIALRSLIFNILFYICTILEMIIFSPFYFLANRKKAWFVPKFWGKTNMWLQTKIIGTRFEITGQENLPEGSYIVAPKHQSFLDTFAFLPYIPDPIFILKRELTWIPLFGFYLMRQKFIPIDRGKRAHALKKAVTLTKERMKEDRQLIIYPEGTRRSPGDTPMYKFGIVEIYQQLNVPVVPIAHNAGVFWPRRKFLRYPGVMKAKFLPPIEPGLERGEFLRRLIEVTEGACDENLLEIANSQNPPPMPETAKKRLKQLAQQTSKHNNEQA